ncbi:TPA: hypothetical protein DEG75_00910, partial [Candidatus Dependentiae bacterium]|nr:hypothetical protein [Candidatus Dependentiae bacterium]
DGSKIVTASLDNTAKIWDVSTGTLLHTLNHTNWVNTAFFSPDGLKVVTASDDHTAKIWNLSQTLSLPSLVTVKALQNIKKVGASFEVTKDKTLSKFIMKLPTNIKDHYLENGTIKNTGTINGKVKNFFLIRGMGKPSVK